MMNRREFLELAVNAIASVSRLRFYGLGASGTCNESLLANRMSKGGRV